MTFQGCDSLVIINTTYLPGTTEMHELGICQDNTYQYNGVSIPAGEERTFVFQNNKGCDSVVVIRVFAFPAVEIAWTTEPSCPHRSTGMLDGLVLSGGVGPLEISIDSGSYQPGLQAAELAAGFYAVAVRDGRGCRVDTALEVGVLPGLSLSLPDAELACVPGSVAILSVQASGWLEDVSYRWSTGATTPAIEVNSTGLYSVEVSNVCQTERAEATVREESVPEGPPVYVPNVFGPASEQAVNRSFRGFLRSDVVPQKYRLRVYDRWGSQVFDAREPSSDWDGMISGRAGAPGVYVWLLEMDWEECGRVVHWQGAGDVLLER